MILGAGPAGCAAAITLRKAGVHVRMVDKASFPRFAPGETVHPGIEPLLHQLGVNEDVVRQEFMRHRGIWLGTKAEVIFSPYSADGCMKGFQLVRQQFDALLLKHAIDTGATFTSGVAPSELLLADDNRILAVRIGADWHEADYFIDATGSHAWIARRLKTQFRQYSQKLTVSFGHAITSMASQYTEPKFIWLPHGWLWFAQINQDTVSWSHLELKCQKSQIKEVLSPYLSGVKSIGKIQNRDVTWRIAEKPADINYFLTGDAASVVDPASSHGVLKALMTGIMAAYLIPNISNYPIAELQKFYCRWVTEWFASDVRELKEMYAAQQLYPHCFSAKRL